MRGDFILVCPGCGDPDLLVEYSLKKVAQTAAEAARGYVIDMSTQEIIFDYRPCKVNPELEDCLSCLDQSLFNYLEWLDVFENDPELVQIKHQIRKLSVMVNKFVNK